MSSTSTAKSEVALPACPTLDIIRLGEVDYLEAWDLQRRLAGKRRGGEIPDTLLLLEHPHTFTLGRRGNDANVLLSPSELAERGIALYHVDRGGDVTYHGPGQLVGYPILKLPDERRGSLRYIRDVERALLLAMRDLGVPAERKEGFSGIWVSEEKVCAIGVKIDAGGVTTHGFAINVTTDLTFFEHIIPCGITGKGVTSLRRVLGHDVCVDLVADSVTARVAEQFGLVLSKGFSLSRLVPPG